MAFSEKVKFEVKKLSHQSCCICKKIGIEIHHIVPQAENGPDTIENAAPLCPSCHEIYGQNPTKRKFIRESRDIWYEICAKRFSSETSQIPEILSKLDNIENLLQPYKKDEGISYLSLGELVDTIRKYSLTWREEKNGTFELAYALAFKTYGDNTNWNQEFNQVRDSFTKNFGAIPTEWLLKYTIEQLKIDWHSRPFTEEELSEFLGVLLVNMHLISMYDQIDEKGRRVLAYIDEKQQLLFVVKS